MIHHRRQSRSGNPMSVTACLPVARARSRRPAIPTGSSSAIGHPVTWIGALISCLDRRLNRATESDRRRRLYGVLALVAIVGLPARHRRQPRARCFARLSRRACRAGDRRQHAAGAAEPRRACQGGRRGAGNGRARRLAARPSRRSSAAIPNSSTRPASARAAIESLAENFSDGIVAPAFWLALGGLAGGVAYKAVNTADSMIGHRTPTPPGLRLGGGALRRSRQPAGLAADGAAAGRRGRARSPGADAGGCLAGRPARRRQAPLAQCRLAGSGDGRRARPRAGRPARLWRRDGRGRLHGRRRPPRRDRRRHQAGAAAVLAGRHAADRRCSASALLFAVL